MIMLNVTGPKRWVPGPMTACQQRFWGPERWKWITLTVFAVLVVATLIAFFAFIGYTQGEGPTFFDLNAIFGVSLRMLVLFVV